VLFLFNTYVMWTLEQLELMHSSRLFIFVQHLLCL